MPPHRSFIISLLDFDSFFCSVEIARLEKENPDIRNQPVGVGQRGALIAINYVARHLGVPKMCTLEKARSIVPEIQCVDVNLQLYRDVSLEIFKLITTLLGSDSFIRKVSIDEAYLDLDPLVKHLLVSSTPLQIVDLLKQTLSQSCLKCLDEPSLSFDVPTLFKAMSSPSPKYCPPPNVYNSLLLLGVHCVNSIRAQIWETFRLTCSAAVSPFMETSKMFAGFNKPNGSTLVPFTSIPHCYLDKTSAAIFSVGPKTSQRFDDLGYHLIRDFINGPTKLNTNDVHLNNMYIHVKSLSLGKGTQLFEPKKEGLGTKQVGVSKVTQPLQVYEEVVGLMEKLCNDLIGRVQANFKNGFDHRRARLLTVSCKRIKLGESSRSVRLSGSKVTVEKLIQKSREVLDEHFSKEFQVITLGITLSNFVEDGNVVSLLQRSSKKKEVKKQDDDDCFVVSDDDSDDVIVVDDDDDVILESKPLKSSTPKLKKSR
ncbi:hypothetical protein GEMRC1_013061 [Eukaryota sp. GEM-RC1]